MGGKNIDFWGRTLIFVVVMIDYSMEEMSKLRILCEAGAKATGRQEG